MSAFKIKHKGTGLFLNSDVSRFMGNSERYIIDNKLSKHGKVYSTRRGANNLLEKMKLSTNFEVVELT